MAKFTKIEDCVQCSDQLGLFKMLSDKELESINEARYEVSFNKGETIFKQGGPLTHLACITEGMGKIYIEGSKNKNIVLKIAKPVEMIGGPGFQVDNRHHFSVSAVAHTKACFIDVEAFEEMLKASSPFAMEFIKHLNSITIEIYNKLQGLTQKQMHGRIADTLLYLSKNIYSNPEFETSLSRQDLADMSAMTKESAIRIIKEFREEEIIRCEGNTFCILDESRLTSIGMSG
jgi:CRP/FNR family transcriptional regulator